MSSDVSQNSPNIKAFLIEVDKYHSKYHSIRKASATRVCNGRVCKGPRPEGDRRSMVGQTEPMVAHWDSNPTHTTDLDPELGLRAARDISHTSCTQARPHFSPGPRSRRTQHRWSYLCLGVHFHKHSSSVRVVTLALANAPASRVTRSFDRAVAQLPLQHRLHGSCGTANLLQACSRSG